MNKYFSSFITGKVMAAFIFLSFTSCKKNSLEAQSTPVTAVRSVGVAVGDVISETIGVDGGIVKSEDGRVEIDIPADALTDDTEIGIQMLKNTAISGIGYSYRFTPHGKIFKKKITVRFHYKKDENYLGNNEALEIAFQNEKGIWTCVGGTVNDTTQKTVSVQTDHFSDWGLIASMELTPVKKTVSQNEVVRLKTMLYVNPVDDDLLVPLTVPNASTGVPTKLDTKYIVKWTLSGPGKLEANGNEAVYAAPSTQPANKTATVTVELNVHGKKVLLISTIYIVDEGIFMSINGGDWQRYPGTAVVMSSPRRYGILNQRISADMPQIVISWPAVAGQKSDGRYNWFSMGEPENYITFEDSDPNIHGIYTSVYDDGNESRDSGGFLIAEEATENGKKIIKGSFIISQSGVIDVSTGKQKEVDFIIGTYKVQRSW